MFKKVVIFSLVALMSLAAINVASGSRDFIWGDVNSDSNVNMYDASLVAMYSLGMEMPAGVKFNKKAADVTQGGKINMTDAQAIAMSVVELFDLPVQMGDIDQDGMVLMDDASLATQIAQGLKTPTQVEVFLADVNGDGKVTKKDARIIAKYAVGLRKRLPVR